MGFAEYSNYDGLALAELVKKKKVKPTELVEAAIERIERLNPQLNAIVFKAYDEARAKAAAKLSGAFAGVPTMLKDILGDKKGWPTRSGSRFVPAVPSAFDATLVARLEGAGLIPLGKTNVPEFGLKPTRARNPLGPRFGDIFGGLIAEHVVGRSVRDTAAALDVTAGAEIGDPYAAPPAPASYLAATKRKPKKLRIAFATKRLSGEPLDPECKAATEAAAKLCAKLGHHIEEGMPSVSGRDISANFPPIWASGLTMVVDFVAKAAGKTPAREEFEGLTWSLYQFGKTVTAAQYQGCWIGLQSLSRQVAAWQQAYDAWITPVLATPPMKIGTINLEETDLMKGWAPISAYVPFTALQNITGQPAISLPLAQSKSGLPIGVQFVGRLARFVVEGGGEKRPTSASSARSTSVPWATARTRSSSSVSPALAAVR
jgi:amidase